MTHRVDSSDDRLCVATRHSRGVVKKREFKIVLFLLSVYCFCAPYFLLLSRTLIHY